MEITPRFKLGERVVISRTGLLVTDCWLKVASIVVTKDRGGIEVDYGLDNDECYPERSLLGKSDLEKLEVKELPIVIDSEAVLLKGNPKLKMPSPTILFSIRN